MPNKSRRTSKLTRAKLARRFRERNRRFKALSLKKQRIKIIKDVVTLLSKESIVAITNRAYLDIPKLKNYRALDKALTENTQLHEILDANQCIVCGIGGVFVSAIRLKNDFEAIDPDGISREKMVMYLSQWFDPGQMNAIEVAFEARGEYSGYRTEYWNAYEFGKQFRSPKDRLIAICKNILANDGKFVPPPYKAQ